MLAVAAALAGCASLAKPNVAAGVEALRKGAYALDRQHASLVFKIDHLGFSKYVGRFERFDAGLDFDAAGPETARVEAAIDMNSLDVADDEFAKTLMGPDWFDSARFPQAVFRSTAIERTGETSGRVTGDLTLHGVTRPVSLAVEFNGGADDVIRGAYVVGFSAVGTISRSAFGVDRLKGLIADEVEISVEAEFKKN
jgi:polyisoprenoid-binding protein YceI